MSGSLLLIQSDSNRHLGLFRDLNNNVDVDILTYPDHHSAIRKAITRFSSNATFTLVSKEQNINDTYDRIVVVDTALGRMSKDVVSRLREMTADLRVILLNSFGAASPSFEPVRERIDWFKPSEIYSFDPIDVQQNGFNFYGLQYYSKHDCLQDTPILHDCYFVGGIKGGRGALIRELFYAMKSASVDALFECTFMKGSNEKKDQSGIRWLEKSWQPYETVLANDLTSACIVEILQEGQHAQSLRYFEAVCNNRKLLTNNDAIVNMPFYDERYMRVFHAVEDVDMNWLKDRELPAYDYNGEFSPAASDMFGI